MCAGILYVTSSFILMPSFHFSSKRCDFVTVHRCTLYGWIFINCWIWSVIVFPSTSFSSSSVHSAKTTFITLRYYLRGTKCVTHYIVWNFKFVLTCLQFCWWLLCDKKQREKKVCTNIPFANACAFEVEIEDGNFTKNTTKKEIRQIQKYLKIIMLYTLYCKLYPTRSTYISW